MHSQFQTLEWIGGIDGHLRLLDQTRLPMETVYLECRTAEDVWQAIKRLAVRGAPAIGVAAAYGVCVGVNEGRSVDEVCDYLATSRPTAVNLFWALERMRRAGHGVAGVECRESSGPATGGSPAARPQAPAPATGGSPSARPQAPRGELCADPSLQGREIRERLLAEARAIDVEDREKCAAMAKHGADLLDMLPAGVGILTHCNAGALVSGSGDGTALGVVFEIARRGKQPRVFADETRPLLQGARLTMWELMQRGIEATLIGDSVAAQVMREGRIQAVITGADRIAANGDTANKIGTYSVATLARAHGIPFYVAAPTTTFDLTIATGAEIPIEQRESEEVTNGFGRQTAPLGARVYNPAFDVTPAELIAAIITDRGVVQPVNAENVRTVVAL
ncbi:MAG: S-methyl-5-thioribose-1-phosphate isomerase [Pirellulales bacterium]